ncbi:hypothetical protein Rhopal_002811-T1 [Rhodotorula paludigena]|uniref:FYR N-terminal domain-containing protein n=1 Tax=Rhodotorula paludigena TaxID=86838 RepID=A0AAV5GK41_9BASI|nr:hypothetical protein Rhopal_002811-T1 [Rhodotorula paludigena]
MATPQAGGGGGGFKLKFTLGGASAAASAAPAPAPAPAATYTQPPPAPAAAFAQPAAPVSAAPPIEYARPILPQRASGPSGRSQYEDDDDSEGRVSAAKYRKLKKLYLEAVESRDDASLALFRAQKHIHRLREDKASLLDRVLELELAAGLTSADVAALREQSQRTERELAFPLLHPPSLPSLADRPRKAPILTTSTELTGDNYNAPLGPAPLPKTFPPRQRSHHLRTAIASQKLRDEYDAQRIAHGLPKPSFPAVAVLGLAGSTVATNVERALAGESFEAPSGESTARGNKRRRDDSIGGVTSGRGKARASTSAAATEAPAPFNNLPNPFAAAGAVPLGANMSRNNAEALAAAAATTQPLPAQVEQPPAATPGIPVEPDIAMDEAASGAEDEAFGDDDGGDYKPSARSRAGGRKSDYGAGGAGDKLVKPKKVKQHNLTSGTYTIPPIPRNADGSIRFPVTVGIMSIKSLGAVDPRDGFHTERYIFPVGFEAKRKYPSMVNRTGTAEYVCRITDGGDGNPRFELHPSDQPGVVITSGTPTGAWTQVVKATNKLRERNHSNSVSGPDYYGLSHNIVKAMIQELPGADQVPGYIWQTFVEEGGADGRRGSTGGKRAAGLKRKSNRGGFDSAEMSPGASEIAVDDGGAGAYGIDTGYDNGETGSPMEYAADGAQGAYGAPDYSAASLQHLLQAAEPVDPYAIPTSMPAQPAGGAIDPYLGGAAAVDPSFNMYDLQGGQPMIDPAFGDAANAFAFMPAGGQPVEYPSSDAESE